MWRRILVGGTVAVVLFAGTAFALASQGPEATPEPSVATQADHWSQMQEILGEDWSGMVSQMQEILGEDWSDMVAMMRSYGFDMGSGMGDVGDMGDMGGFDMGSGMGDVGGMGDMGGFDMGSRFNH